MTSSRKQLDDAAARLSFVAGFIEAAGDVGPAALATPYGGRHYEAWGAAARAFAADLALVLASHELMLIELGKLDDLAGDG